MLIRAMEITDYDSVSQLWGLTTGMRTRSADSREKIALFLARNPGMSLVVFDEDDLVGAVLLGDDGRRGYIYHFTIKESHRRKGIGRLLEAAMSERLKEKGIEKIFLSVYTDNTSAREFWSDTGWDERPEILMMSKLLVEDLNA